MKSCLYEVQLPQSPTTRDLAASNLKWSDINVSSLDHIHELMISPLPNVSTLTNMIC